MEDITSSFLICTSKKENRIKWWFIKSFGGHIGSTIYQTMKKTECSLLAACSEMKMQLLKLSR
ncbi:hypothetical protein RchiOBHm_Chr7g0204251 [Rosa chinensis]|uniref:Uncharacterized protein n=1 Tax=Rosa chinensis TaxID=74649 RepID=A0A2P6P8M6_ROSCH|nr:hypothetical protein RchiOBHm_Chr7g0204251 [Rosa chinensis]